MTQLDIALLVEMLPEHALAIRRRLIADLTFRTICGDYETAVAALRHWQACNDARSAVRRAEYRSIVESLEHEIRTALAAADVEAQSSR